LHLVLPFCDSNKSKGVGEENWATTFAYDYMKTLPLLLHYMWI
jgi:hypothetical protein